jgi:hypothetical protein
VELNDGPAYDRKYRIELWDLAAKNLLHSFAPFSDARPIVLSPDGKQLAVNHWLIDLENKAVRQVPNIVEQYLPKSQLLLCSRQYHPFERRTFWNESRDEMELFPFVRHLPRDMPQESLLLLDQNTGRVISRSQWVPGYRSEVVLSKDGRIAATINPDRILVWEIPE